MTSLPADNLGIRGRGRLDEGYFADIVVFDPERIQDHATFEFPHQYATGVEHVFVNGVQVLEEGKHTGALPGRVVRGPGWTGWSDATDSASGVISFTNATASTTKAINNISLVTKIIV